MDTHSPSFHVHLFPALSFRYGFAAGQRKCSDLIFTPGRIDTSEGPDTQAAIQKAGQEERNRIGGELHDNISQLLVTSKLLLTMMQSDPRRADEVLPKAIALLSKSIDDVRSYAHAISGIEADRKPLADEIATLLEMVRVASGMEIEFSQESKDNLLVDREQETDLYRIIQEVIHNIIKHAGATQVQILCHHSGKKLELTIRDNGKGFDPFLATRGAGLHNLHQRAQRLGALCVLDSAEGKGTSVFISVPATMQNRQTA